MEKREARRKSTGACEKIYKAIAGNRAVRSIRRISLRSQSPTSDNANLSSPNHLGGRTADSPSRTQFFLDKQVATHKPRPDEVNIPIQPGPSIVMNEKAKMANPSVSPQSKGRVIMISSPKIQSAGHPSTTTGDKTGTAARDQTTKPVPVATAIEPQKAVKASIASTNAHLPKVSSKKEAKSPVLSVEEKPKRKAETIAPSNMIVVQSPGQGVNGIATPRAEPAAKPDMAVQESQLKSKGQTAASVVKVKAKQDEPINDNEDKEVKNSENGGAHDHNRKYSDYIEHVKKQWRTKSNSGEETTTARPPAWTATVRDSFDDRVSNFITQAKKNIITTSHVGN